MAKANALTATNIQEYSAHVTYLDSEIAVENESLSYSCGNSMKAITGWIAVVHLIK